MGLLPRKVALCAVMLCAALVAGCMAEREVLPTAAEVGPVIPERGAVAQQYWTATQAFQRAPLGFKVRLEAAIGRFTACSPGGAGNQGGSAGGEQYQIIASWGRSGCPLPSRPDSFTKPFPSSSAPSTTLGGASSSRPHRAG
jgi:hypothetical protein